MKPGFGLAAGVASVIAAAALVIGPSDSGPKPSTCDWQTKHGCSPVPAACHLTHARNGAILPDPACTPGATNPDVTEATAKTTICTEGYTARIRPPLAYTESLKRKLVRAYGLKGGLGKYELDHLIPLEGGGAPSDPQNLWPEHKPGAFTKDKAEHRMRRRVCSGAPLHDLQVQMASDWTKLR